VLPQKITSEIMITYCCQDSKPWNSNYYQCLPLLDRTCRRGLNLSGELSTYETETRELYRTGHGHYSVEFLPCVGRVVESYVRVLGIEVTDEIQQWRVQLELERRERLQVCQEDLDDEERLVEAMGGRDAEDGATDFAEARLSPL
ncbi:hypothetical protein GN958_ATG10163, partial [Phytophthora infestans]